jgi:hypothetical protein
VNCAKRLTSRSTPELVTSGPYRFVGHPIYSGILLALLDTAVAINLYALVAFGVALAYFVYCAGGRAPARRFMPEHLPELPDAHEDAHSVRALS